MALMGFIGVIGLIGEFSILNSQFSILNSQFSILNLIPSYHDSALAEAVGIYLLAF